MQHIWDDLLTEQDHSVIHEAGYAKLGASLWDSRALGNKPALLIIDMQQMAIGRDVPILKAIQGERTAMGEIAWRALDYIIPFVSEIRRIGLPIFYSRVIPRGRSKIDPEIQIIASLAPQSGDIIIDKPFTSVFFKTDLELQLKEQQVDTLILIGNSTSGCLRTAAVDARQRGFHPLVPIECAFDRIQASHKIALMDMWMKYAAVMTVDQAVDFARNGTVDRGSVK